MKAKHFKQNISKNLNFLLKYLNVAFYSVKGFEMISNFY